ncbi:MAG TPA: glycosyltransferase, partial [Longimicrobiaceae bacterium]
YVRFPLYPDYRVTLPLAHGVGRELDAWRPDLVHVVSPTPMASWAQRWAARRGVPVVSSFHTHFVSYFRYYGVPALEGFGWGMLRRFYARCARVYAPSRSIIRELEAHGIGRLELWSRGMDTRRFSPAFRDPELRRAVGADDRTPILLLVSRLVKEKDLADLVEMEALLRARGVPHRLQRGEAVVAEVGDEVGVEAGHHGEAAAAGVPLRPGGHGGGADHVHEVGAPRVQLAGDAASPGEGDAVVRVEREADVAHPVHPSAPRHLRPGDEGGVHPEVHAPGLQRREELGQGAGNAVHVREEAFREVGDLHRPRM